MQAKIFPRSLVGVTNTRTPLPAIVNTPTLFSGLDYKKNPKSKTNIHQSEPKNLNSPKQAILKFQSLLNANKNPPTNKIQAIAPVIKECKNTWVLAPQMRLTASA